MKKLSRNIHFNLLTGLLLSITVSDVFAAATQLFHTYSAVAVGDGDSGGAARANDATTTYSNPAGLIRLTHAQAILSAVDISTDLKFTGTNTWSSPVLPRYTQAGTAQGGMSIVSPAIFYAMPLSNRLSFGFSTVSPFGLKTTYGEDSILRYSGTKGEITVVDLSPTLGFKIDNQWSIGGGLDINRIIARIDAMVGAPSFLGTSFDAIGKNNAYGWGYGAHIGVLSQLDSHTRFGVTYRSSVRSDLAGFGTLSGRLVQAQGASSSVIQSRTFKSTLALPPVTTLSGYHDINSQWSVQGSVNYIQWSTVPGTLSLQNLPGFPPITPITVSLPQHYRDTWYLAAGANFQATTKWLLRTGLSFDETPVKTSERNILLPDGNRIGVSFGAHYQLNKNVGLDAGWTHLFVQDVSVNLPTVIGSQTSTASGRYKNHADLVGGQIVWDFV